MRFFKKWRLHRLHRLLVRLGAEMEAERRFQELSSKCHPALFCRLYGEIEVTKFDIEELEKSLLKKG